MNFTILDLVNLSITAGWAVLAVMLLRLLLQRAPKWITCLLWGIVGLRLLLPFSLESAFSLIPSAQTIDPTPTYESRPNIQSGITFLDQEVNEYLGGHFFEGITVPQDSFHTAFSAFGVVWICGIAAMLFYSAYSYWKLRRIVSPSLLLRENLYLCDNIASPFVLGLFRPRIYLPSGMTDEHIAYVVRHENAHIRRKDHWWKPIGFLLLSVHWFNPILWIGYWLFCRDIELACDEKAISDLDPAEKKGYSETLLSCSLHRRMILACPLAFGEVCVKDRIRSVLNYRKPAFWLVILALILSAVAAFCLLTNPKQNEDEDSPLSYRTAIQVLGTVEGELQALHYPKAEKNSTDFSIQIGAVNAEDLTQYLRRVTWYECRAPFDVLSSPGSVEFILEEDYRITVYARKDWALRVYAEVRFGDQLQYYRIAGGDYDKAVKLLHSTNSSVSGLEIPDTAVDFLAKVLSVSEGSLLVEPLEGTQERNSADQIRIGVEKLTIPAPELNAGDLVRIVYNGNIMETYPAQLHKTYAVYPVESTPKPNPPEASTMSQYEVSYANYTDRETNYALFFGALNRDKLYINHTQHLPIRKFESLDELEAFRKQFANVLTMDRGYNEIPSFQSVIEKFYAEENASFWENNVLFLVYVSAESCSNRYGVQSIYNDGTAFQIRICRTDENETGDSAMSGWFVTVIMSRDEVATCTEFDAIMVHAETCF